MDDINDKKVKTTLLLSIFLPILFFLSIISASFAWVLATTTADEVIMETGTLDIKYRDTNTINTYLSPSEPPKDVNDNKTAYRNTFEIENVGNANELVEGYIDINEYTFIGDLVYYRLYDEDNKILKSGNIKKGRIDFFDNVRLPKGAKKSYTLLIWLDKIADDSNQGKVVKGTITVFARQENQK